MGTMIYSSQFPLQLQLTNFISHRFPNGIQIKKCCMNVKQIYEKNHNFYHNIHSLYLPRYISYQSFIVIFSKYPSIIGLTLNHSTLLTSLKVLLFLFFYFCNSCLIFTSLFFVVCSNIMKNSVYLPYS